MTILVEHVDFGNDSFLFLFILLILASIALQKSPILYITSHIITGSQFDDKNVHSEGINELVLDGGFPQPKNASQNTFFAPEINAFGHAFRFIPIPFHCFIYFFDL